MKSTNKTLIVLIISSLILIKAEAQKYNSFAGIRVGYSLPMGQFASHDFGTGGYALLGKSISGEAAWFINPKIGFGVDASTSTFGFASGYFRDDYLENEPSYQSMDLLSGPYKVQTYMGGVYYKLKFSSKFISTFKLMGGMYTARTPDRFFGVDSYGGVTLNFWKTGSLDRTFGLLTGASFEYNLFDHVGLLLQADFSYAEPEFHYYNGVELYAEKIKMPIFKLLPGINVRF
jgi:hypothetical protein